MNNWDNIVMLDGGFLPVSNVDHAYFVFIKTKAGYDSFISESKKLNCSTYGIEQPDEESITEKVLNQGFIWNYPTCSYIPLSKFLEKEYSTIRKYEGIVSDCVSKYVGYVGKFKEEANDIR